MTNSFSNSREVDCRSTRSCRQLNRVSINISDEIWISRSQSTYRCTSSLVRIVASIFIWNGPWIIYALSDDCSKSCNSTLYICTIIRVISNTCIYKWCDASICTCRKIIVNCQQNKISCFVVCKNCLSLFATDVKSATRRSNSCYTSQIVIRDCIC